METQEQQLCQKVPTCDQQVTAVDVYVGGGGGGGGEEGGGKGERKGGGGGARPEHLVQSPGLRGAGCVLFLGFCVSRQGSR